MEDALNLHGTDLVGSALTVRCHLLEYMVWYIRVFITYHPPLTYHLYINFLGHRSGIG